MYVTMVTQFKDWLRSQMEIHHWTQNGLGSLMGVTHVTVGKWLLGKHKPDPDSLNKLADLTGTDAVDLFVMVGYLRPEDRILKEQQADYSTSLNAKQEAIDIFHEIGNWPDEMLDLLTDQIRFVLKPRIKKGNAP